MGKDRYGIPKTWKSRKLWQIRRKYEDNIEKWKDAQDDRRVFVNMFNIMIEAICSLPEEPYTFICVAMNDKIDKYMETMDSILGRFADR